MCCKNNILITLAYYDVLDFPLKEEEIFRFLVNFRYLDESHDIASPSLKDLRCPSVKETREELEELKSKGVIGFAEDFYFLFGRNYLVPLRLRREKMARKKWEKIFRAVKWLKFPPYIKAVFASGSLAMSNTDELGDLDVLVIAKYGHIWLSRLFVSGLLSLIGMRRKYSDRIAPDKICLNHYITDKSLLVPYKSIYTAQTYINLRPVFISNSQIITEFYEANSWLGDYVLNFSHNPQYCDSMICHSKSLGHNFLTRAISKAGEIILNTKIGNWLEGIAKRWQVKRIKEHEKQNPPGGRVIYNDEQLEFHPGSVEKEIIEKYNQRLKNLGLGELTIKKNSESFGA